MTENQILTAITSLATVAILFANWRINDMHARISDIRDGIRQDQQTFRESMREENKVFRESMREEQRTFRESMVRELQLMREALRAEAAKNHSELLTHLAGIEQKQLPT